MSLLEEKLKIERLRLNSIIRQQSTEIRQHDRQLGGLRRTIRDKDKKITKLEKYIENLHNESY
jgi:hypothetical protein